NKHVGARPTAKNLSRHSTFFDAPHPRSIYEPSGKRRMSWQKNRGVLSLFGSNGATCIRANQAGRLERQIGTESRCGTSDAHYIHRTKERPKLHSMPAVGCR